ncbi:hypothetical protein Tco_0549104 [Tanacetum coccineum]
MNSRFSKNIFHNNSSQLARIGLIFKKTDSDDERTGSSVSYIILSDSEVGDTASPAALTPPLSNYVLTSPDYPFEEDPQEANPEESSEEDPSEEDPSDEDLMEYDEPLPAQATPAPPTHPLPTIYALIVHPGQEIPLRHPYWLHRNGSLLMLTSRKTMRVSFTLPLAIEPSIIEEIVAPPRKRCRPPSPPPSPLSSSTPSAPSLPPAMLPPRKRFRMTSPHQDATIEATNEAIIPRDEEGPPSKAKKAQQQQTNSQQSWEVSNGCSRLRRALQHPTYYQLPDYLEEISLERFESIEKDIEGLHDAITS